MIYYYQCTPTDIVERSILYERPTGSPFPKSCHYLWHKIFFRTAKKNALPTKVKCKSCRMQGKGSIFISTCIKRHYIRNSLCPSCNLHPLACDFHWVANWKPGGCWAARSRFRTWRMTSSVQCVLKAWAAMRHPEPCWGGVYGVYWQTQDSCTTIHNLVLLFDGRNRFVSLVHEKSVERQHENLSVRDPRCIRRRGGWDKTPCG